MATRTHTHTSTAFEGTTAFPLTWPLAKPRTASYRRRRWPRDGWTLDRARRELELEVQRLGGSDVVLSSNIELRLDGLPYSGRRTPDDPGVALWMRIEGEPHVLACDCWDSVSSNVRAITRHIEALRGIARWGVGDLRQAFAGYRALPAPVVPEDPWIILGLDPRNTSAEAIKARYRELALVRHPDQPGGSTTAMAALSAARDRALREVAT